MPYSLLWKSYLHLCSDNVSPLILISLSSCIFVHLFGLHRYTWIWRNC